MGKCEMHDKSLPDSSLVQPFLRDGCAFFCIPGTTYLATIVPSLRDGPPSLRDPGHFVSGYYHLVPLARLDLRTVNGEP